MSPSKSAVHADDIVQMSVATAYMGQDSVRPPGLFLGTKQGRYAAEMNLSGVVSALQAKLLRVLENGEVSRIGSNETIKVDVRLIAATNQAPAT